MKGLVYLDPHARCAHRRYGLTCESYDQLAARSGGCCEVCGTAFPRLHIDHDHAVGQHGVRGLVCRQCNSILRDVDYGRRKAPANVVRFLERAWHLTHPPHVGQHEKRRRETDPEKVTA